MNEMTDPLAVDAIDMARSTLPVYLVAESPDGPVYSHDGGFPEDDTPVWVGADGSNPVPLGDLYAQYGEDVIAYAEPEVADPVTAAIDDDEPDDEPDATEALDPTEDAMEMNGAADMGAPDPLPEADERVAVRAALINQAGHDAIVEIETFLDQAEQAVAISAALTPTTGGGLTAATLRMAVGGNPTAQQQVRDAFETHYDPDINRFIFAVLGERPQDNANHDGEAWDAVDREARIWHAKKVAVAASAPHPMKGHPRV